MEKEKEEIRSLGKKEEVVRRRKDEKAVFPQHSRTILWLTELQSGIQPHFLESG